MQEYDHNFKNAADFAQCMNRGCEVEFLYAGKNYSITQHKNKIILCEMYNESSEKQYQDPIAALEYKIDGKKLEDILSKMKIIFRTF